MKKLKQNIPNIITISRIISSIIAPILLSIGNMPGAIGLYIYGAISDCLDGLAARKLKAFTELGRQLDPLSDKIYAASLLVSSILLGNYLMLIPLVLEGEISATTLAARKSGVSIETERVGKYKTCLLFVSLILGVLASFYPAVYFILMPTLLYTTNFQVQCIHAYENQYHNKLIKKYSEETKQVESNKVSQNLEKTNKEENIKKPIKSQVKNKLKNFYYEFQIYQNVPIEPIAKNNAKKLQRKIQRLK